MRTIYHMYHNVIQYMYFNRYTQTQTLSGFYRSVRQAWRPGEPLAKLHTHTHAHTCTHTHTHARTHAHTHTRTHTHTVFKDRAGRLKTLKHQTSSQSLICGNIAAQTLSIILIFLLRLDFECADCHGVVSGGVVSLVCLLAL